MVWLTTSIVVFIGIILTGFGKVHWFLRIPVIMMAIAGITGKCFEIAIFRKPGFK
jgi:hypothetical protein